MSKKDRRKKLTGVELEEELSTFPINPKSNNPLDSIKVELKCKNESQKKLSQSIRDNDVTICTALAGSGKTYIAVAEALKLLKTSQIRKIVLVKSVTTLKSEEVGFLKGTLEEKMEPFVYSFINNFEKIIGREKTITLRELNIIEIIPIAYMRGITIDNAVIIVDEAQNISHDNIKTILTRMGENSKIVILGDVEQIDLKNKKDSSLSTLMNKIKNNPKEGVNIVYFNDKDIVRHRLTSYFVEILRDNNL